MDVSDDVVACTSSFSVLSSPNETVWFLSVADYTGASESAFAWNEFEVMSTDAALSPQELESISRFWAVHLPILISVREGEYAYLAVRDDGVIVYGAEPEFETTIPIANSLHGLLEMICQGTVSNEIVHSLLFDRD